MRGKIRERRENKTNEEKTKGKEREKKKRYVAAETKVPPTAQYPIRKNHLTLAVLSILLNCIPSIVFTPKIKLKIFK